MGQRDQGENEQGAAHGGRRGGRSEEAALGSASSKPGRRASIPAEVTGQEGAFLPETAGSTCRALTHPEGTPRVQGAPAHLLPYFIHKESSVPCLRL